MKFFWRKADFIVSFGIVSFKKYKKGETISEVSPFLRHWLYLTCRGGYQPPDFVV